MKKYNQKSKGSRQIGVFCQEKLACTSEEELAIVKCVDCTTIQCDNCQVELHKDGDYFFHQRIPLGSDVKPADVNRVITKSSANVLVISSTVSTPTQPITSLGAFSSSARPVLSDLPQSFSATSSSPQPHRSTSPVTTQKKSTKTKQELLDCKGTHERVSVVAPVLPNGQKYKLETPTGELTTGSLEGTTLCRAAFTGVKNLSDTDEPEPEEQFHSLSLDLILSAEFDASDMKGSSKKAKRKPTSGSTKELSSANSEPDGFMVDADADFFSAHESDANEFSNGLLSQEPRPGSLTENHDEDIVTDLMQSVTETQLKAALAPAVQRIDSESRSKSEKRQPVSKAACKTTKKLVTMDKHKEFSIKSQDDLNGAPESFLLIDDTETIQVCDHLVDSLSTVLSNCPFT